MTGQKKMKTTEDTMQFMKMVADKQQWRLNRDTELLEILAEGLTKNFNRYGYYSCPCRDASGIREQDKDIICPCDYCRPDQDEFGHCYCGLYLTIDFFERGTAPSSIPERRPEEY
ncbi:MAG TPA: ferredoxin-thioredoxin reductase catalytic domain-containing protein [Spirochaetota bacterium]|nr:ferredoxin-thioredoxin reductase catalytic domain-containing protein [Spirochaetota bacterium]HPQ52425.1 ferredoxin-thioredoxin reductase catalytic domain-containing protein [Spirochaetota bacterium]